MEGVLNVHRRCVDGRCIYMRKMCRWKVHGRCMEGENRGIGLDG